MIYTYTISDLKVKTNLILCAHKQKLLYDFYIKCDNCDRSLTLSRYYETSLEVIKFIERYFLTDTMYIKNYIKFKYNNEDEYTSLQEKIQNYTLYVFEINDDDFEMNLSQEEIDNYVKIIEQRTSFILQHQDIIDCFV